MALTTTILSRNVVGVGRANTVQLAFDGSYPTGGEAITVDQLGMRARVDAVVPQGAGAYGAGAYTVQYDGSTGKVLAISLADGAEAGDTTDLGAFTINVLAIGT